MADDAAKYDAECRLVMKLCRAHTVVLIVVDGHSGHGMSSASTDPKVERLLPELLRDAADKIEQKAS